MDIMPAVDIRGGNAVRLVQGDYDKETIFGSPKDFAKEWVKQGANHLHLVDLDGAKVGYPVNLELVQDIVNQCDAKVQLGGGLRSLESIQSVVDIGISRFIVGTSAISDRELLALLAKEYAAELIVSVDIRGEFVSVSGWLEDTAIRAVDFFKELEKIGVRRIIYTDIERDGVAIGPNLEMCQYITNQTKLSLIVAGGISDVSDIAELKLIGVEGVIIGRALYTGDVDLSEALEVAQG